MNPRDSVPACCSYELGHEIGEIFSVLILYIVERKKCVFCFQTSGDGYKLIDFLLCSVLTLKEMPFDSSCG